MSRDAAILRALRKPPVGVGIVCLIVGVTSGHWSVLGLFWISYVVGYLTGKPRYRPNPPGRFEDTL